MAAVLAPTLIKAHPGPQTWLLTLPQAVTEIMYGGTRGGGKSFSCFLDFAKHQERWGKHAKGLFLRRYSEELEDFITEAKDLFAPLGAIFRRKEPNKTFIFPNGATLKFAYVDRDADARKYQGRNFTRIYCDDAGIWKDLRAVFKLGGALRSACPGISKKIIYTSNPGGPSHNTLKRRFVTPVKPLTPNKIESTLNGETHVHYRIYIPSSFYDNPSLCESDPSYLARINDMDIPEHTKKAWIYGDWDIIAGGMFDDLWRQDIHQIRPFKIPSGWHIFRSFDWGSTAPFALGHWAISDGEWFTVDGEDRMYPKGTHIRIGELYGAKLDKDGFYLNEGLRQTPTEQGLAMRDYERTREYQNRIAPGPADLNIFDSTHGVKMASAYAKCGINFVKAKKGSRVTGWQKMRDMLAAAAKKDREAPGLYAFENCSEFVRTVPSLQRDNKNLDDADTTDEDHIADETRYAVTHQPVHGAVRVVL